MTSENVKPPEGGKSQGDDESWTITSQRPMETNMQGSTSRFDGEKDDIPIKIVGPNNEEIHPEDFVVAPDGGWGWVIVFAAFMSNLIVDGTVFSFGILTDPIASDGMNLTKQERLKVKTQVSWVGGMLAGFGLCAGPVVSAVSNIFGFRITAIAGSFTAFFGFFMGWVFNQHGDKEGPNLPSLYGFVGFLGGVGLCLLYIPSITTVSYYFDKRRALATGIALCGSGIGTFIYAPFVNFLLFKVGWPMTLMIESILILSCTFVVVLYRPLKPLGKQQGPTVPDVAGGTAESVHDIPIEHPSLAVLLKQRESGDILNLAPVVLEKISTPKVEPVPIVEHHTGDNSEPHSVAPSSMVRLSGNQSMSHSIIPAKSTAPTITLLVDPSHVDVAESRIFRVASKKTLNKPMHHPDIFYAASIHPDKSDESPPSVQLEAVPISIAESELIGTKLPRKNKCNNKCYTSTFPVLSRMLDFSLLKSMTFLVLIFSAVITYLGYYVPFMFITEIAQQKNLSPSDAAILLGIIGASNTVGRVICGFIADKVSNRILLINNVALTIAGASTALVPLIDSYAVFFVYACVFGLSIACFVSLRSVLLVQLLGIKKLTNAFGLLCLFQGSAAFVGGPLAGFLKEVTESYNISFIVAGSLVVLSAVICYPLNLINSWEKKRLQEKELIKVKVL